MRPERQLRATVTGTSDDDASVHYRVGQLLGLPAEVRTEIDLIERLEKGLPVRVVEALRARAGLSDDEVYQLIASRRTLNRRKLERQRLSAAEADRAVRVARVTARAQQVFSARPAYAREWLRATQRALGDRSPFQVLTTDAGTRAVEEILLGIEHGQFG